MKRIIYLSDSDRVISTNTSTWYLPDLRNLDRDATDSIKVKLLNVNVLFPNGNTPYVQVRLLEKSSNYTVSTNKNELYMGNGINLMAGANMCFSLAPDYNPQFIISSNKNKWEFKLYTEAEVVIPNAGINGVNMTLEIEYV